MKLRIRMFVCLLVYISSSYAQDTNVWKNNELKTMQVSFKIPEGFSFSDQNDEQLLSLQPIKKYRLGVPFYFYSITANDSNFVAYLYPSSKDRFEFRKKQSKDFNINIVHLEHIKLDLLRAYGDKDVPLKFSQIKYESEKYAIETFNADTIITYDLRQDEGAFHKGKYNHCKAFMIQKNDRGYIAIYCFYNDIAMKRLDSYLKPLEGIFWFHNPEDYIEVSEKDYPIIKEIVIPH